MGPVLDNLDLYTSGFLTSLGLVLRAAVGALVLGTLLTVMRVSPVPLLRTVGTAYVTVVRNTPLTVVLFTAAFAVPVALGVTWSFYALAVGGLVVYTAAFVCEAERSGINAVSPGQAEAARALGLGFGHVLTLVVLPQALRTVVPPLGNVLIAMIKNSAVVGAIGVSGDLFAVYNRMVSALGYPQLESLIGMAVGYLVMTLTAAALLRLAERRLEVAR